MLELIVLILAIMVVDNFWDLGIAEATSKYTRKLLNVEKEKSEGE
jgi:hypothetical protein